MRRIQKGSEPPTLMAHREKSHLLHIPAEDFMSDYEPTWDNYLNKDEARACARQEQRQICAFCQASIAHKKRPIKLAHVVPQKDPTDGKRFELVWSNIVGACLGGEDTGRPRLLHCDSLQGSGRLCLHLDPVQFVDGSLSYDEDGRISSSDPEIDREINALLGLNIAPVKDRRLAALSALEEDLSESLDKESRKQELLGLLAPDNRSEVPLLEYADFLLWHLRVGKVAAAK